MDIVHVACKLPHGIKLASDVVILGVAHDRDPNVQPPEIVGGYRITLNVPAQIWAAWAAANVSSAMVVRDLVFAEPSLAALKAKAKSLGHVRSGFEAR